MMAASERNRELIADLAAECRVLGAGRSEDDGDLTACGRKSDRPAWRQICNSLALRVPKTVEQQIGAGDGKTAEMSVHEGKLVTEVTKPKRRKRRYTLDELVAGITPGNRWGPLHLSIQVGRHFGLGSACRRAASTASTLCGRELLQSCAAWRISFRRSIWNWRRVVSEERIGACGRRHCHSGRCSRQVDWPSTSVGRCN